MRAILELCLHRPVKTRPRGPCPVPGTVTFHPQDTSARAMSGARHRDFSSTGRRGIIGPWLSERSKTRLPSLWTAAGGEDEFSERDAAGNFLRWTPAMEFVWPTKDELPARKLCAAGK